MDIVELGLTKYSDALAIQRRAVRAHQRGAIGDTLLLTGHYPVFTVGRHARDMQDEEVFSEPLDQIRARGIDVERVERDGFATYHCPGHVLVYPIRRLPDRGRESRTAHSNVLDAAMVDTVRSYGIDAYPGAARETYHPGAYVREGDREVKIGATGCAVSREGIPTTFHGCVLYVDPDHTNFSFITPCNMPEVGVTSMRERIQYELPVQEVGRVLAGRIAHTLGVYYQRGKTDEFLRAIESFPAEPIE